MPYGLAGPTIEKISNVFANYSEVTSAILYGSRAKGTYQNGSDIDLAVTGTGLNLSLINKICNDIDDLLLPYSFDISIYTQISDPDLLDHIKRVGVVFYSHDNIT